MDKFLLTLAATINIGLLVVIVLAFFTRKEKDDVSTRTYIFSMIVFGINVTTLLVNGFK